MCSATSSLRGMVVRWSCSNWIELRSFSLWNDRSSDQLGELHLGTTHDRIDDPCIDSKPCEKTVFLHVFDDHYGIHTGTSLCYGATGLDGLWESLKVGDMLTVSKIVPVRLWNSLGGFTSTPGSAFSIERQERPMSPGNRFMSSPSLHLSDSSRLLSEKCSGGEPLPVKMGGSYTHSLAALPGSEVQQDYEYKSRSIMYRIWYIWAINRIDRLVRHSCDITRMPNETIDPIDCPYIPDSYTLDSKCHREGAGRRPHTIAYMKLETNSPICVEDLILECIKSSMEMSYFELPCSISEIKDVSDFIYALVRGGQDEDWLWGMLPEVVTPRHALRLAQSIYNKLSRSGISSDRSGWFPRNMRHLRSFHCRPCARSSRVVDVQYKSCLVGQIAGITLFGYSHVVFDISLDFKSGRKQSSNQDNDHPSTVKVMCVGALPQVFPIIENINIGHNIASTQASNTREEIPGNAESAVWIVAMNVFFLTEKNIFIATIQTADSVFPSIFPVESRRGDSTMDGDLSIEQNTPSIVFLARACDIHLIPQRIPRNSIKAGKPCAVNILSDVQSYIGYRGIRSLLCLKPSSRFGDAQVVVSVKGIVVSKELLISSSPGGDAEGKGSAAVKRNRSAGMESDFGRMSCCIVLRDVHRGDVVSVHMDISESRQIRVGCLVALRDCRFIHSKNLKDVYLLWDKAKGSTLEFVGASSDLDAILRVCDDSRSPLGLDGQSSTVAVGSSPGYLDSPKVRLYDIVSKELGDHRGPGDGINRRTRWSIQGSLSKINFLKAYLRCNSCGSHIEIEQISTSELRETERFLSSTDCATNTSQFDVIIEYSDTSKKRSIYDSFPRCRCCGATDSSPAWKLSGFFDDNTAECKIMAEDDIALALLGLGSSAGPSASMPSYQQGRKVVLAIEQAVRMIGTVSVTFGSKITLDEIEDVGVEDDTTDELESSDESGNENKGKKSRMKASRRDLSRMVAQYLATRSGGEGMRAADPWGPGTVARPSAPALIRYCQQEMQKMIKNSNLSVIHDLIVRWVHAGSFNGVKRKPVEVRTTKIQRADQPEFMMECIEASSNYYRKYAFQVLDHRWISDTHLRAACWDLVAELE